MSKRGVWVGLVAAAAPFLLSTGLSSDASGQEKATFSAAVERVVLAVAAVDDAGMPVPGLGREDFRVRDEGEPAEIRSVVSAQDSSLLLALAVDVSGSVERFAPEIASGAMRLVHSLAPRDCVALMHFAGAVQPPVWTRPHDQRAQRFLQRQPGLEGGTAVYDAVIASLISVEPDSPVAWSIMGTGKIGEPETAGPNSIPNPRCGPTLGDALGDGQTARRAAILITDGEDVTSQFRYEDALVAVWETNVPVFVVGVGSLARPTRRLGFGLKNVKAMPGRLDVFREQMTDLAEVSGGRLLSVPTPDTMAAAFEEVLNRLRAYYLISFVPNDAPELKGQWHDVDIEVLSDNVKAHHAPRYFLGNTDPTAARSAVRDGLEQLAAEQLQPALDSFERASWADPRLAAAYYHAARVLARQGRSEDALAAFWRAWERDPGAADFQIAELSLQSGDFEAAWRHTVQAAIAGHDITALRTRLEHLSNTPDDIDQQLSVPRIFVPDGVFADPEVRPAIDDLVRAVRWATWQNTDLGLVRDIRNGDYVTKLIFNESPRPTDEHITVRFEVHDIRGAVFREDVRIGDLEDEEAVRARFADVLVAFANR